MSPIKDEIRNLNTIPVGSLGIIPLEGCRHLGEKVDQYLVKWREERENEHADTYLRLLHPVSDREKARALSRNP